VFLQIVQNGNILANKLAQMKGTPGTFIKAIQAWGKNMSIRIIQYTFQHLARKDLG
jgi:hypothetical protein